MKLPRDLAGAEAIRRLQRLGFVVLRQAGSHIRLGKGGLRVTVPCMTPWLREHCAAS